MRSIGAVSFPTVTRWRIETHASVPEPTRGCTPFLVQSPRGDMVGRFACEHEGGLCPCLMDALERARLHTFVTGQVVVVLRERDREIMGRTGPSRGRDE
jgi:hypothetical protein